MGHALPGQRNLVPSIVLVGRTPRHRGHHWMEHHGGVRSDPLMVVVVVVFVTVVVAVVVFVTVVVAVGGYYCL